MAPVGGALVQHDIIDGIDGRVAPEADGQSGVPNRPVGRWAIDVGGGAKVALSAEQGEVARVVIGVRAPDLRGADPKRGVGRALVGVGLATKKPPALQIGGSTDDVGGAGVPPRGIVMLGAELDRPREAAGAVFGVGEGERARGGGAAERPAGPVVAVHGPERALEPHLGELPADAARIGAVAQAHGLVARGEVAREPEAQHREEGEHDQRHRAAAGTRERLRRAAHGSSPLLRKSWRGDAIAWTGPRVRFVALPACAVSESESCFTPRR